MTMGMPEDELGRTDRRRLLRGLGAAGLAGLAGCTGDGGGGTGGDGTADGGTDTPDATDATTATGTTAGSTGGGDPLKIGVAVPLSGDLGFFGKNIVPAVRYVADQMNQAGGVAGREVTVLSADTRTDADTAVGIAQRFINVENVHGLVGFTAATLFKVLDQVQQNGVPYFAATSSGDLVPVGGEYVYMVFPSDLLAGRALGLSAAREEFNGVASFDRMALLVAQEGLYSAFTDPIRRGFRSAGGEITEVVEFQGGKSSYQSEAQRAVDSDPEVIGVLAGPSDVVKLMRACFNAGYQGQYIGAEETTTDEFLSQAPAQLTEGMLGVVSTSPEYVEESFRNEVAGNLQSYAEREYGIGTWLAYDATTVLGLSMKRAAADGDEVTRQAIADSIKSIGRPPGETVTEYPGGAEVIDGGGEVDFQGIRSDCNFTDRGNVSTPYNVFQVTDGEWETVTQIPADDIAEV
jgi:ABC-type branched-subunit amino acid transport system substrate-binding protein